MVLYCSPECTGYAELWQAWKYMTICCISFYPCRSIRKQIWPCHKTVQGQPVSSFFYKFGCTRVPDHVYHVSKSSASWFRRRLFLKVFTIYGPGRHLGHVTRNIWTYFHPNIHWRLHMKFGFKRSSVFWGKGVWKCWIWVTLDKHQRMTLTLGCHKSSCTHLCFKVIGLLVPEKKIFKGFYHIWTWQPSWSC